MHPVGGEHADELHAVADPDHAAVVAQQVGQRLLEGAVEVDRGAELAGAHAVHRLEVLAPQGYDAQSPQALLGADEVGDELVGGLAEQLGGRAVLRQPAALGEDRHPVAHLHGLVDVVGDHHDRLAQLALQAQELLLQPHPHDRVDGTERLVHQQHRRVGREGPGHADALALAAGELVGEPVGVPLGVEADQLEQLDGAGARVRLRLAVQQRHGHHVGDDALVREEPDLLDDVADAAAQLDRVGGGDVLAVDLDGAGRRLDEAVDHLQRGRLAAARRADQHHHLAGEHLEVEVLHRDGVVVEALAHAREPDHHGRG